MGNPPPLPQQLTSPRFQTNHRPQQTERIPTSIIEDSDESKPAHQYDSPESPTGSKNDEPLYTFDDEPNHSYENAPKKFKDVENAARRAPSLIRKYNATGAFSENSEA